MIAVENEEYASKGDSALAMLFAPVYRGLTDIRVLQKANFGQLDKFLAVDYETLKGPIEMSEEGIIETYGPVSSPRRPRTHEAKF